MKYFILTITLFINITSAKTQLNMRPVNELINTKEPGWNLVKQWIDAAKNKVIILPADTTKAK